MKSTKLFIFFLFSFFSVSMHAQEVTDYDLERFAVAYVNMVDLNLDAQNKMAKIIDEEGLTLEEYHSINETKNDPDIMPDLPQDRFDKFNSVQSKIKTIQEKLEKDVEAAFAKQELTRRDYFAIAERVKQDVILQTKLEKILSNLR